jgi:quaternary ammonium compound-resistance protein SugE
VGTAYAVWTGIGAAGTAILGMAVLGESAAPIRVLCIILILTGVIGLKLASGS